MKEMRVSIAELQTMSYEDKCYRIRERVIDMYERIGAVEEAIKWLWQDVSVRQKGI